MSTSYNSLLKVFTGEHGTYKNRKKIAKKTDGCEIGALYSCDCTNSDKEGQVSKFLGKILSNPVHEKIYMDIGSYFSNGPSTRLLLLEEDEVKDLLRESDLWSWMTPEEFKVQWDQAKSRVVMRDDDTDLIITYMSKLVSGYKDLGRFCYQGQAIEHHLEATHTIPSNISIPQGVFSEEEINEMSLGEEQQIPLTGIMECAAIAYVMGDRDWLGGTCKNTGITFKEGNAVATYIDAGFAADKSIEKLPITDKNKGIIPYRSMSSPESKIGCISIAEHSIAQQDEFYKSLYLIVNRYDNPEDMKAFLKAMVDRNGALGDLLQPTEVDNIVSAIMNRVEKIREVYASELSNIAQKYPDDLASSVDRERERQR